MVLGYCRIFRPSRASRCASNLTAAGLPQMPASFIGGDRPAPQDRPAAGYLHRRPERSETGVAPVVKMIRYCAPLIARTCQSAARIRIRTRPLAGRGDLSGSTALKAHKGRDGQSVGTAARPCQGVYSWTSTHRIPGLRRLAAVTMEVALRQPLLSANPHLRADDRQTGGRHPASPPAPIVRSPKDKGQRKVKHTY